MEIFLNVLWLLVTATIAGTWIGQGRNRQRWLGVAWQVVALTCASIFLFPVISATDDLQATVLAVETTDGKQNPNKFTANGPRPNSAGTPIFYAILQDSVFSVIDSSATILFNEGSATPSPISFPGPLENRPPPSRTI